MIQLVNTRGILAVGFASLLALGSVGNVSAQPSAAVREVRVVSGLLVAPVLVVIRSLPVVTGSLLVVVGGLAVMLSGFLRHDQPPTGN